YAETYAKEENIPFVSIGVFDPDKPIVTTTTTKKTTTTTKATTTTKKTTTTTKTAPIETGGSGTQTTTKKPTTTTTTTITYPIESGSGIDVSSGIESGSGTQTTTAKTVTTAKPPIGDLLADGYGISAYFVLSDNTVSFAIYEGVGDFEIPEVFKGYDVVEIDIGAFWELDGVTITIPKSIKEIKPEAFIDCANVTIRGYSGTVAETAAAEYGFDFVPIEETEIIVGDIDGDGKTGKVNDIVMLAKYLKGNIKLNSETLSKAQCTKGDSVIDTADLTALIAYLMGTVSKLPS
ncbi:MAG: dockerin type I repeat-containing protein, partial [Oscillospiraceae bacterium]|nr:dockerin type I repeat-containing protein [Oscillospiraceae bacterium]